MKRFIALFAAAGMSIAAGAAGSGDPQTAADDEATFKAMDRNADERLSQAEVSSDRSLTELFAALDADSDGYLSKMEYAQHTKQQQPEKPIRE